MGVVYLVFLGWDEEGEEEQVELYEVFSNTDAAEKCADYCLEHEECAYVMIVYWEVADKFSTESE